MQKGRRRESITYTYEWVCEGEARVTDEHTKETYTTCSLQERTREKQASENSSKKAGARRKKQAEIQVGKHVQGRRIMMACMGLVQRKSTGSKWSRIWKEEEDTEQDVSVLCIHDAAYAA